MVTLIEIRKGEKGKFLVRVTLSFEGRTEFEDYEVKSLKEVSEIVEKKFTKKEE